MQEQESPITKISVAPLTHLQKRKSEKWRAFEPEILPMPFAVMDYELADPIKGVISNLINDSDAGYLGKIPELGENYSEFASNQWQWSIDPLDVKIAPDVGVAVIEVARTMVKSGDQIMINSPVYFNFFNWISELHCHPFDAPLLDPDKDHSHYRLDFEAIEAGYQSGVKLHIICHPHNPVGALYSKEDLIKLATLAHRYGVIIFSDEIHAPLVYDESTFTPFLASCELAKEVGIAFVSATKAFSFAGLKCAQYIAQSDRLREHLKKVPVAVHSRASLYGAIASATAWSEGVSWLTGVVKSLDHSRKLLQDLLSSELPKVSYRLPQAGYFGWLNMRKVFSEEEWSSISDLLYNKGKIAVASGHLYGPTGRGFIRINFATSDEIVAEAVERIKRALPV
jgi:cystathionine beta-lyase